MNTFQTKVNKNAMHNFDMNEFPEEFNGEKNNQNFRNILGDKQNILEPQPTNKSQVEKNDLYTKSAQLDENSIDEYIEILIEHQRNCERSGRYVEAEMARKRVLELKNKDDKKKKDQIRNKHGNEKMQLEEAHLNEFNQFNEFWDRKMEEYNEQAKLIEQQMIEKHHSELEKFVEELDKAVPFKPKDSAELLNFRKIQESLAKQQNYVDAHKVQQKCIQLEKEEYEKWAKFRDQKIRNQRNLFEQKQNNELFALQKRISSGQDEQRKARSMELERLLQKYQNAKKELDTQQQNELLKFEKVTSKAMATNSIYKSTTLKGSKLNDSRSINKGNFNKA